MESKKLESGDIRHVTSMPEGTIIGVDTAKEGGDEHVEFVTDVNKRVAQEDAAKKEPQYNIKLMPEEIAMVDKIIASGHFSGLEITRRSMVRYIILRYSELLEKGVAHDREISRLRSDINDIRNYLDFDTIRTKDLMIALVGNKNLQLPTTTRKPKPARSNEEGALICNVLGGVVDGDNCKYTNYKVMPTGAAVDYEVTIPLGELSEESVSGQYSPSKEKFDEARQAVIVKSKMPL